MEKSLIAVVLICTALIVGYAVFSIMYLGLFETRENFTLSENIVSNSEADKFVLLGQHYSDEKVVGWTDNSILFELKADKLGYYYDLYKYCLSEGRREKIASRGDSISLSAKISGDKKNILIDHRFGLDSSKHSVFLKEKHANKDYNYHTVGGENNSFFEIYNISTKRIEKLFDYTVKLRVDKEHTNAVFSTYKSVCISNNFKHLLCYEKENRTGFSFINYDIDEKTAKTYEVAFKESESGILQWLSSPSISSDGNTMWIIEKLEGTALPNLRETTLYMLDFRQKELNPQAIASNLYKYMVSLDNKYIVYSTDPFKGNISKLICMNNKSKKEYTIEENIFEDGFVLSSLGNVVAYLAKDEIGAKLYIKDFEDEESKSRLIYTFDEFLKLEYIDFSSDGKSVFVSYITNKDAKALDEYQMCLINLGDF